MPNEIIKTFKGWAAFEKQFKTNIPEECFFPENKDICWEWQGAKHNQGYGRLSWGRKKEYYAHRMSYLIFKGPVPKDQVVCHTCDNPSCVNPKHLFLGSHYDNSIDMVNKERQGHQKLNEEAVKVIKWMLKYKYKRGLVNKLAKLYKVNRRIISHIKHGNCWGHIKV